MHDSALAVDDDGSWASVCAFGCVCVSTGISGVCSGGVCGESDEWMGREGPKRNDVASKLARIERRKLVAVSRSHT